MKSLHPLLAAALSEGATTLCQCWIVTRRDGLRLGFTDHDNDLTVEDTLCRAGTGFDGSSMTDQLGLAVTGGEVAGALSDDAITESDLLSGLYDGASVRLLLVDWSNPAVTDVLRVLTVGEVTRADQAFVAELHGPFHRLDQAQGRRFSPACSADLGDARCKVSLASSSYRGEGTVIAVPDNALLLVDGLDAFTEGLFTGGRLTVASGVNAGSATELRGHQINDAGVLLSLFQPFVTPLAPGDAVVVTAGCDKTFATCRDRFANQVNFRGFPQIPGNDFAFTYPVAGDPSNDGSSLS